MLFFRNARIATRRPSLISTFLVCFTLSFASLPSILMPGLISGLISGLTATMIASPTFAGDPMVVFRQADAKMTAAITEAQNTLPRALTLLPATGKAYHPDLLLKVAFPRNDGMGNEIIWVSDLRSTGKNRFSGRLDNAPNYLTGKRLGSKVRFSLDQVADWSILAGGRLWGNYTTRVMLPQLPAEDRRYFKTILSDRPIP